MASYNENYLRLPGSYLFSTIAQKVKDYSEKNPGADIIRLGIGDVTKPLTPSVIKALHSAVDEMGSEDTFKGYAPDLGYDFLRDIISKKDFKDRGCDISPDEIFVSDGAKSDCGNLQEIFGIDNKVAICDPVYPVYVDSNVMAGRSGEYDKEQSKFKDFIYMPCTEENGYVPELPAGKADIIYLCYPNNPTGAVIDKERLSEWVSYARKNNSVIIYDAAYERYISDPDIPHSIYECEGAKECAIEVRSFSKTAGFTGLRLGYTVIPHELKLDGVDLWSLWKRRHGTKYNGAPYIVQKAGEAVYSDKGCEEVTELIAYYMENARIIREGLISAGFDAKGGVNAPYIWLKCPDNMTSWEFFDHLLSKANVVGTPGSGFGPCGEHYFRLTAFGSRENTKRAVERLRSL